MGPSDLAAACMRRECNGIKTILKLIGDKNCPRPLAGLLAQSLTVLAVGNEINQDNVR